MEQIRCGKVPKGYKKSKLGIVPNDWNETVFSTLFTSTSQYTDDLSRYPLYSLTIEDGITAKTERYERSHLVKKENAYKVVRPGDYAYNPMNIRFGAVARHKGSVPVAVSGYYDIFTTVHEGDLAFMDSFLTSDSMITYYNKVSTGSLIEKQRVHVSDFMGFSLALPPIEERKRIAEILAAQDKVIELKEKRLAEKQRQKKYLAKQMFSGMKCVVPLSELALITMGQSPSSETYNTSFNGVPLIQGNADISNRKTFPRMYTTSPTKICSPGDILISVRAPVGTVARSTISACIGRGICSIRPKRMSDYIYEYLLYYEDKWGRVSQGSTFESISGDDIGKLSIPQHHESDQVAKMLTFAGKEIDLLSQDIEQEKRKKKALMQLLLTGIVRVNV
jgi:type I restriction enzyme S subunit